jgi:methyl-accepting chemotaxis protein
MVTSKGNPKNEELISEAIFELAREIRFLGNGHADRSVGGHGAIEGLAMKTSDAGSEVSGSISGIADAIRTSGEEIASSLDEVATAINALAQAISGLKK